MKNLFVLFNLIILIFSLSIVSIGYSAFNTNYSISGDAIVRRDAEIRITNLELIDKIGGAYENYNSTFSKSLTSMSIGLPSTSSSISYRVTITNKSGNYFTINSIGENIYSNNNVKYTISEMETHGIYHGNICNFVITFTTISPNQNLNVSLEYDFQFITQTEWSFDSSMDSSQKFIVPYNGVYKIEAWGAQGGDSTNAPGGCGAYTRGNISLNALEPLYIFVGKRGKTSELSGTGTLVVTEGGFNGGGRSANQPACCSGRYWGSGGGATDVRLVDGDWNDFDSLKSRIMVAAGGGGSFTGISGGAGGALEGFSPSSSNGYGPGSGGSQTVGGKIYDWRYENSDLNNKADGGFGYGGFNVYRNGSSSGGGSGYYGGGGTYHIDASGGGSSFVSGYSGCNAISKSSTESNIVHTGLANHYSEKIFSSSVMIDGKSSMPTHNGLASMVGNSGDGYLRISLVLE